MKLKAMMVAAALGGTVLTVVPAVLPAGMLTPAYACDYQTDCVPEEEPQEPEWPDPNPGGDNTPEAPPLDPVEIIGSPPLQALPDSRPVIPGAGGGSPAPGVNQVGPPQRERQELRCFRNNSSVPQHVTQQLSYTTSWQVSENISGGAQGLLTAQLGVQFNTSTQHVYTVDMTVPPGQSIGIYAEYERTTYIVTTGSVLFGYTSESVSVRSPTNTMSAGSC